MYITVPPNLPCNTMVYELWCALDAIGTGNIFISDTTTFTSLLPNSYINLNINNIGPPRSM